MNSVRKSTTVYYRRQETTPIIGILVFLILFAPTAMGQNPPYEGVDELNIGNAQVEGRGDMESELAAWEKQGRPVVRGELPSFSEVQKIPHDKAAPPQPRPEALTQELKQQALDSMEYTTGKTHLKLVLRLKEDGSTEVLSATQFEGGAVFSEAPTSDYIYEVTTAGKTLAAEALPGDPFEFHSFGGTTDDELGHHFHRGKEATVVVTVPDVTLKRSAFEEIDVNLYRLDKGPPIERVNPDVFRELKQKGRFQILGTGLGKNMASDIRSKGQKR